jgi:tRNA G10  N-methylase Trm11
MRSRPDILAQVRKQVLELTRPGDLVIDPMCGSGVILGVARAAGRDTRGFDVSPAMVGLARRLVRADVADARAVPMGSGACQMVLSSMPSHQTVLYSKESGAIENKPWAVYLDLVEAILREFRRVLDPRGRCVLIQSPAQAVVMKPMCLDVGLPTRFILVPEAV